MNFGTRNHFEATVTNIKIGTVMCQIDYELANGQKMSSVITIDSADEMGLHVGDKVDLIVKAINVIPIKK